MLNLSTDLPSYPFIPHVWAGYNLCFSHLMLARSTLENKAGQELSSEGKWSMNSSCLCNLPTQNPKPALVHNACWNGVSDPEGCPDLSAFWYFCLGIRVVSWIKSSESLSAAVLVSYSTNVHLELKNNYYCLGFLIFRSRCLFHKVSCAQFPDELKVSFHLVVFCSN